MPLVFKIRKKAARGLDIVCLHLLLWVFNEFGPID
jgi:hypothetical protein